MGRQELTSLPQGLRVFFARCSMTEDRRKEIALKIVEQLATEKGIPGGDQLRRDLGNMAKNIGVQTEELMGFYESLLPKVIGRIFGYQQVGLTTSKKFQIHGQD